MRARSTSFAGGFRRLTVCGCRCRLGLITAWASIICLLTMSGTDGRLRQQSIAHIVLVSVWAFGRLLHTLFYTLRLSILRTTAFSLAMCGLVGMAINAIVAAFRRVE